MPPPFPPGFRDPGLFPDPNLYPHLLQEFDRMERRTFSRSPSPRRRASLESLSEYSFSSEGSRERHQRSGRLGYIVICLCMCLIVIVEMDPTSSVIRNELEGDILLVSTDIGILERRGIESGIETERGKGRGTEREIRSTVCTRTRGHDIATSVSLLIIIS